MSELTNLVNEAFEATGRVGRLASAVHTLEEFGLPEEQRIQLEVLLRERLGEVSDRLRQVLDIDARGGVPCTVGGAERGERVVEALVDVHDSSSRVGASVAPDASGRTLEDPAGPSSSSRGGSAALRVPDAPAGSPAGESRVYRNLTPLLCVFTRR